MCHQRTPVRARQQVARDAAEHPFAQAAVAVCAGDGQVDALVLAERVERGRIVAGRKLCRTLGLDRVTAQPRDDVLRTLGGGRQVVLPGNLDDADAPRMLQERQGVRDGTASGVSASCCCATRGR